MSTTKKMTCICCPIGCALQVKKTAAGFIVTGNKCPRGKQYAIAEMTAPNRIVTSTVAIIGALHPVISVKTEYPIPKDKIFAVMDLLSDVELQAPIHIGDVVVKNISATGVNVVATKNFNHA